MHQLILALAIFLGLSGRHWDGQTRFTVLTLAPHVVVKSFDPATSQGLILNLPDNLEIAAVAGRGEWVAGVIAQAGSRQWAADSVADTLGITYTQVSGSGNWWDNLRWRWYSRSVGWRSVDLGDTSFVAQLTTPDKVLAYQLSGNWDGQAKTWFADQAITDSQLGVGIINATGVPGLGINASRVVESMGFKVRSLTTADKKIAACVLQTRLALKSSIPVRKLLSVFGCTWEKSNETDLQLTLGQKYREWKLGL